MLTDHGCPGGGTGYISPTARDSGSTCTYENSYYSQCQPGSVTTLPPAQRLTPSEGTGRSSGSSLDAHIKAKGKIYWGTASDEDRFSNAQDSQLLPLTLASWPLRAP